MKQLSACSAVIGVADSGLRMVVRELLLGIKMRDVDYVNDSDGVIYFFRNKPGLDLIIVQNDLPVGGGAAVAQFVRWNKLSPNTSIPIISVGREWTPEKLLETRDAGINEVIAMPTSIHAVQRKLLSALDGKRPFISTDTYRGPCRRRHMASGYQGPFRRASDRIREQINSAADKSMRRAERMERQVTEASQGGFAVPLPRVRQDPTFEVSSEARFLSSDRLKDFQGRAKQAPDAPSPPAEAAAPDLPQMAGRPPRAPASRQVSPGPDASTKPVSAAKPSAPPSPPSPPRPTRQEGRPEPAAQAPERPPNRPVRAPSAPAASAPPPSAPAASAPPPPAPAASAHPGSLGVVSAGNGAATEAEPPPLPTSQADLWNLLVASKKRKTR